MTSEVHMSQFRIGRLIINFIVENTDVIECDHHWKNLWRASIYSTKLSTLYRYVTFIYYSLRIRTESIICHPLFVTVN